MSKRVRFFRFNLFHLLLVTTLFALGAWALANPSADAGRTISDLMSLALIAAVVGACVAERAIRASCIAFALTLHLTSNNYIVENFSWKSRVGTILGRSIGAYSGPLDIGGWDASPDLAYVGIWSGLSAVALALAASYVSHRLYEWKHLRDDA